MLYTTQAVMDVAVITVQHVFQMKTCALTVRHLRDCMLKTFYKNVHSDSWLYKALLEKNRPVIDAYLSKTCPNKHKIRSDWYSVIRSDGVYPDERLIFQLSYSFHVCDGCDDILCPTCDSERLCPDCKTLKELYVKAFL